MKIADNTGAKIGRIFKVLGGSKRRYACIGDLVVLSVQTAEPRKAVKKKDVSDLFYSIAEKLGHKRFIKKNRSWREDYRVTINHYVQPEILEKVRRAVG